MRDATFCFQGLSETNTPPSVDRVRGVVWHSDGQRILKFGIGGGCGVRIPYIPVQQGLVTESVVE